MRHLPRRHRDDVVRVPPTGRRLVRRVATTGLVGTLAGVLGAGTAVAVEAPVDTTGTTEATVEVTGTLRVVIADAFDPATAEETSEEVLTMVEVDGVLHDLTGQPALEGTPNGADVVLTFEADPGLTGAEALAEVAASTDAQAPAAGTPADAAVDPAASLVAVTAAEPEVAAAAPGAAAAARMAATTLGRHTLTVLPVYGAARDGQTRAGLTAWANAAAAYWSEQSGGRLSFAPTVRDWRPYASPATCDPDEMWAAAMAAHGLTTVSATQHVVVYFPERSDCDWAGLGSVGGGEVWVNGLALEDVLTHELGHNLGLGHANAVTCTVDGVRVSFDLTGTCAALEYADTADVMGIAQHLASGNLTTASADVLGLAQVTRVATAPVGQPVYVDLAPLAQVDGMRAVSVPAPGLPGARLYVDFRPATGRDVRERGWAGVQVHLAMADAYGIPETYLIDLQPRTPEPFTSPALAAGTSWTLPGLDLTLHVRSVGTTARIAVTSTQAPMDTTAPSKAVVTAPAAAAVVTGAVTARWRAATDAVGVTAYEVLVDGRVVRRLAGSVTSADLGALPPGPHSVSVDALDAVGNRSRGARVSFTTAADATQRYVARVYADLFGRSPDGPGLVTWGTALSTGTPRVAVANAITASDEYRGGLIRGSYAQYLGRSADAQGLASWLDAMRRGLTIQHMEAGFVASPEYYLQSGSTDAGWVRRLYQDVLGRTPSAAEVRHWQRELAAGAGRDRVATGFLLSTEHLTTVVDGHYRALLGRPIDPTGAAHWVAAIQRGTRIETIVGGIIASDEYAARG